MQRNLFTQENRDSESDLMYVTGYDGSEVKTFITGKECTRIAIRVLVANCVPPGNPTKVGHIRIGVSILKDNPALLTETMRVVRRDFPVGSAISPYKYRWGAPINGEQDKECKKHLVLDLTLIY